MTLTELGKKHGTDKATHHGYTDFYETILKGREITKMIEVGVLTGASLKMWREYFPFAFILGIDINPIVKIPNVPILQADGADRESLMRAIYTTGINRYDLIIDDGGHTMKQQQTTFATLWPFLAAGGIYIIEDLHTSRMWEYKHVDDAITTEDWIKSGFQGSNHALPVHDVARVEWWHNKANTENDSITCAIFKAVPDANK
jgi:hypothetical protein